MNTIKLHQTITEESYPKRLKYKYKIYKFEHSIQQQIKTLAKLDNWHGILALLEDYSLIIISILITYYISWYFYPLAILIIGARQRALATLLHEAAHRTLAKNKHLNFALGTYFSGYLILQTFTGYKKSHVDNHHRYLGHPILDPDYYFHISEGLYSYINPMSFVKKYILMPLVLSKVPNYLYTLIQQRLLAKASQQKETLIMCLYILIITATLWNLNCQNMLILFWIIPYLTTFQIIGWFIELSEHYPLVGNNDIDIYMTRNRQSHWLEAFFLSIHNENYHLDHHLNPSTPFWNLAKAHQIRLQDKNYAALNKSAGGIFISANDLPSLIQTFIAKIKV
ncbi:dihydrorhizobitoxine desaturase [Dulcicalothrix desertica PCC 7102]|uniref:Dihydrorhizobitoxine desaturase n=1 Tax=Dulcicalothrix desertica PCC 7102 TaxID=232991 RepID=A0A433URT9_9CYAN|nr:guanitoxin biosynthesis L-arginine gamma (S) hydroxylase [Dulcicalothrix desertica]RUS96564.1 dihydrorhizobitoxine desaturase [Dulcicalothrix desertica PCC 7102]TWH51404.1 fatty acid desaturase [Dulcicalothrix desertica PCC 7102]